MVDADFNRVSQWCTKFRTLANYTSTEDVYIQYAKEWKESKLNLKTIDKLIETIIDNYLYRDPDNGYVYIKFQTDIILREISPFFLSGRIILMLNRFQFMPNTVISIKDETKLASILKLITAEYHIAKFNFDFIPLAEIYYTGFNYKPNNAINLERGLGKLDKQLFEAGLAALEQKYPGQKTANGLFSRISLDKTRNPYERFWEAFTTINGCYKLTNRLGNVSSCKLKNRSCQLNVRNMYTCDENESDGCSNVYNFLLYAVSSNDPIAIMTLQQLNGILTSKNFQPLLNLADVSQLLGEVVDERYTTVFEFQKNFYKNYSEPWDCCQAVGSLAGTAACNPMITGKDPNGAMELLPPNMAIHPIEESYKFILHTLVDLSIGTNVDFLNLFALVDKPCMVKQDTDCIDGGTDNLVDKLEEEKDTNYWLIVALIAGIIIVFAFIIASLTQSSNYKKIINEYNRQQQSQIIKY